MAQVRKVRLVFESDPGHGWYAVKGEELMHYDVVDAILSGGAFSYHDLRSGVVYLEEDRDARILMRAVSAAGDEVVIVDKAPVNGDSFVRSLPYFTRTTSTWIGA